MSAIKIENLTKTYKLYNNPLDRVKEALHPFRRKYYTDFFALKKVNFDIKKGETVGIIGKNGSGKSTLLKIITGVLSPTEGNIVVEGRVSALLELGAGFNPELTGLENIYFTGAIMGYTREEIEKRLDAIIDFADIGDFISQPLKIYSSGMMVRLAFAAAINVDPEILIIDEALAVGDMRFQQKCFRKFKEFQNLGKTILFVSHDTGAILNYCDKALWLKDGEIHEIGRPEEVCRKYIGDIVYDTETTVLQDSHIMHSTTRDQKKNIVWESVELCSSFGDGSARIKRVALIAFQTGASIYLLEGEEKVSFQVEIEILQNIERPIVGFILKDSYGNSILGMNSYILDIRLPFLQRGETIIVDFQFDFPMLKNGYYFFSPAIAEGTQDNHIQHHWIHDAYMVQLINKGELAKINYYFLVRNPQIYIYH